MFEQVYARMGGELPADTTVELEYKLKQLGNVLEPLIYPYRHVHPHVQVGADHPLGQLTGCVASFYDKTS